MVAEMVEALPSVLALGHERNSSTPAFLTPVLRNIVVGLARLPLVNSYTRVPPLVSPGRAPRLVLPPAWPPRAGRTAGVGGGPSAPGGGPPCPRRGALGGGRHSAGVGSAARRLPFLSRPQVWKLGWAPVPGGDFGTAFPEIPVEFLQEKEVFREFIFRINALGSAGSARGPSGPCGSPSVKVRACVLSVRVGNSAPARV